MAVELMMLVPFLMAMVAVVVAGARYVDARGQVNDAAYAAARAASLQPSMAAAVPAGHQAAQASLAERGRACVSMEVSFAGTDFQRGGHVQVQVNCHANLSDVAGFGIPGAKTFTANAVVPIESFRDL